MTTTVLPETRVGRLAGRYYDPATAQFTTPDPLFAITGSRYGYAANDPVNGSDPSGLSWYNPCVGHTCASDVAQRVVHDEAVAPGHVAHDEYNDVIRHITLNYGACVGPCAHVTFQNGHLVMGLGGSYGLMDLGPSIGWNSEEAPESGRGSPSNRVCIGIGVAGCIDTKAPSGSFSGCEVGPGIGGAIGSGGREFDIRVF